MAVSYGAGCRCLVCGRQSFLTVHRKCARKFSSARARGLHFALAGRGQHTDLPPGRAVPASFSRALPVGASRKVGQEASSLADVVPPRLLAVDRSDPRPAAAQARVAAHKAARSAP